MEGLYCWARYSESQEIDRTHGQRSTEDFVDEIEHEMELLTKVARAEGGWGYIGASSNASNQMVTPLATTLDDFVVCFYIYNVCCIHNIGQVTTILLLQTVS